MATAHQMFTLESAGQTDVGNKRKKNEDSLLVDDDLKLYVVADGMGGHLAGEIASKLVVDTMKDYLARFHKGVRAEEMDDAESSFSQGANRLIAATKLANNVVYELSLQKDTYSGMGSTVSALYFTGDTFTIANIGDSPVYLINGRKVKQISATHTVAAEHAALHPQDADKIDGRFNSVLTKAMGRDIDQVPDIMELQLFNNDILVLCSDGLSNYLPKDEIRKIVQAEKPAQACKTMVNLALERGGADNITVIVIRATSKSGMLSQVKEFFQKSFR